MGRVANVQLCLQAFEFLPAGIHFRQLLLNGFELVGGLDDHLPVLLVEIGVGHGIVQPLLLGLELFDLAADPGESDDLRARQAVMAGLLLANWRRQEAGEAPLFAIDSAEIDEELAARLRDLGYIR